MQQFHITVPLLLFLSDLVEAAVDPFVNYVSLICYGILVFLLILSFIFGLYKYISKAHKEVAANERIREQRVTFQQSRIANANNPLEEGDATISIDEEADYPRQERSQSNEHQQLVQQTDSSYIGWKIGTVSVQVEAPLALEVSDEE